MYKILSTILQIIETQPDIVLSEKAQKHLDKARKTGICNQHSVSVIGACLRCQDCSEAIADKWFTFWTPDGEPPFVLCDVCYDKTLEEATREGLI